jgi:hypothetical protein
LVEPVPTDGLADEGGEECRQCRAASSG